MTRIVKTQDELDKALAETMDGWSEKVEISSPKDIVLKVSGRAKVTVYDSVVVIASDSAHVTAYDSATVEAFDSARVFAHFSAQVYAYESAWVTAYDSAMVFAHDSARVFAHDSAMVIAYDEATVSTYDSATVSTYDSATIHASQARAMDPAAEMVEVHMQDAQDKIEGGVLVPTREPKALNLDEAIERVIALAGTVIELDEMVAAMRPVVEAAERYRDALSGAADGGLSRHYNALLAAVDTYREVEQV